MQGVFVGFAFLLVGVVAGSRLTGLSYKHSVWVANPITVGVGFAAYKVIYHSLHLSDYLAEYDSQESSYWSASHPHLFSLLAFTRGHVREAGTTQTRSSLNCRYQAIAPSVRFSFAFFGVNE